MAHSPQIHDHDAATVSDALAGGPAAERVAGFVPGPGIAKSRGALDECLRRESCMGDMQDEGFAASPMTQWPGQAEWTSCDLSGHARLPADGPACFANARSRHTALNGGETRRAHAVVARACGQVTT